jgi:hypothetical protein
MLENDLERIIIEEYGDQLQQVQRARRELAGEIVQQYRQTNYLRTLAVRDAMWGTNTAGTYNKYLGGCAAARQAGFDSVYGNNSNPGS